MTGSSPENALRATVEEVLYLGERVEYRVRTISDRSFLISSSRHERYDLGAELDLVIDTNGVILWPQKAAAAPAA